MRLMRLLCLCLFLSCATVCVAGGPLSATATAAAPAAAAPSTPAVPQPAPPGESLPVQPPAPLLPGNPPAVGTQPTAVLQQAAAVEGNPDWAETLERIAGSVVSIDVDSTRAFDTEWNSTAQATGFVVDAERGLILTNRHVVTPGPVTAEATFLNREEVQLYPVYRDPVHDFGIYRYDPAKLRFIAPAPRPGSARLRRWSLQRLQYLLYPGGFGDFRGLLRLTGRRRAGPRRRAQRRRFHGCSLEFLPAAGPGPAGVAPDPAGPARDPRH